MSQCSITRCPSDAAEQPMNHITSPLERLPYDIVVYVVQLMSPGTLIKFGRINQACRNMVEQRLVNLGVLGSYAYCVHNSALTCHDNDSDESQYGENLLLWKGSHHSLLLHQPAHSITVAVRRLIDACYNDHLVAFKRQLHLHGESGLPGMVCSTADYPASLQWLNGFLFSRTQQEYARACLSYQAGMNLLNSCTSRHLERPGYGIVAGSQIHADVIAEMIINGMSLDLVKECLFRSIRINDEGRLHNTGQTISLLGVVMEYCNDSDARLLTSLAVKRGAIFRSVYLNTIDELRIVNFGGAMPNRVLAEPIFAAARTMSLHCVQWPLDLCLEHSANINQELFVFCRVARQGFTRRTYEVFTITPILTYLLHIPWRSECPVLARRVLHHVSYMLDHGAYLSKSTHTHHDSMENAKRLKSLAQYKGFRQKSVVSYSPVDLLLTVWVLARYNAHKHPLYDGAYFDIIRGLIDMGCDAPSMKRDMDVYKEMCTKRGLEYSGEVLPGDDGIWRELAHGFDSVD